MKIAGIFLMGMIWSVAAFSQNCGGKGQTPSSAFPVCGSTVFEQNSVPLCSGTILPSPSCRADMVADVNPYWYKFTCFEAGTLGFVIIPKDLTDDYDWELYDITGKDPMQIYKDGSLTVASNWSGEEGVTGASAAGASITNCAGEGKDLFSKMPSLKKGHDYLLLISHFTQTQSGYSLEFKGGSAFITDTATSHIRSVLPTCGADTLLVKLTKGMQCNSIATDGSDFVINPGNISPATATGINCSSGFDTDSLRLTLNAFLSPGDYVLQVRAGSDGNTLLDNCLSPMAVNEGLPFTIAPKLPVPMDSLKSVTCVPSQLQLVFKDNIRCSSIAPDGSDFVLTGPYVAAVISAAGVGCTDGTTKTINVQLGAPLQQDGQFTLHLRAGSDGNTLLNACNGIVPAGSAIDFTVKDTVNADFTYQIKNGCEEDEVDYFYSSRNGVNSWNWSLDESMNRLQQNPVIKYRLFNNKQVKLIVSNGFCSDTSVQTIALDNLLKVAFDVAEDNCPLDPIPFKDLAKGKIMDRLWDFDDGNTSGEANPEHTYSKTGQDRTYRIRYTVTDSAGCAKSVEKSIKVYMNCYVEVPNAFSPNGDNMNDIFYPLDAVKADHLDFKVYNRWGQLLYATDNWKKGWDGTYKGVPQPAGEYIWTLSYTDRDTNKQMQRKGTVLLTR